MNKSKDEDFIRVVDEALPEQLCDQIINIFDNSSHVKQGQIGGGVDMNKKIRWMFQFNVVMNLNLFFKWSMTSLLSTY
jgi:hypothetical protein